MSRRVHEVFTARETRHEVTAEIADGHIRIELQDGTHEFCFVTGSDGAVRLASRDHEAVGYAVRAGNEVWVQLEGRVHRFSIEKAGGRLQKPGALAGGDELRSPMTGTVRRLFVEAGATVVRGQQLLVLEAMKMEHVLKAPRDGSIEVVAVVAGQTVDMSQLLVRLAAVEA